MSKALPSVDFSHRDLAGSQERPEQHCCRLRRREDGLRLDPSLELLMQAFDRVRGPYRFPLAFREAREGEELVAGLLQTYRNGRAFQPPFAQESSVLSWAVSA